MGNRWSRSWALAQKSMEILRSNPQLAIFPIVTGVVTILLTISFFVPAFFLLKGTDPDHLSPVWYGVTFLYYFISYFIVVFFNTGMVSCTYQALQGQTPTFGDGINHALKKLGPILGWAFIAATVGMIFRMLSERSGLIGRIVIGIVGGLWNIITYFVVPIMAFENKGPVDAIKGSGAMLKRTWGENLIGNAGIGFVFGMLMIVPIVPFVGACLTGSIGLIIGAAILCAVSILILATISASLQGIYQTALYVYGTTGQTPTAFEGFDFNSAFTSKPQSKISGYFRR